MSPAATTTTGFLCDRVEGDGTAVRSAPVIGCGFVLDPIRVAVAGARAQAAESRTSESNNRKCRYAGKSFRFVLRGYRDPLILDGRPMEAATATGIKAR